MDRHDFLTGMKRLQAAFGKALTDDELEVYWEVCRDVDIEDWDEGVNTMLRSDRQFMPRAGMLRRACGGRPAGPRPWAQNAAGSSPADPDRPKRIGEMSVHSGAQSRAYAKRLMGAMSRTDFEKARAAALRARAERGEEE